MPVFVEQRPMNTEQVAHFSRVLRDDADARAQLQAHLGSNEGMLYAGVFNGAPVAMALISAPARLEQLVVHPATRGRGVGTEVLRLLAREIPGLTVAPALTWLAQRAGVSPET